MKQVVIAVVLASLSRFLCSFLTLSGTGAFRGWGKTTAGLITEFHQKMTVKSMGAVRPGGRQQRATAYERER